MRLQSNQKILIINLRHIIQAICREIQIKEKQRNKWVDKSRKFRPVPLLETIHRQKEQGPFVAFWFSDSTSYFTAAVLLRWVLPFHPTHPCCSIHESDWRPVQPLHMCLSLSIFRKQTQMKFWLMKSMCLSVYLNKAALLNLCENVKPMSGKSGSSTALLCADPLPWKALHPKGRKSFSWRAAQNERSHQIKDKSYLPHYTPHFPKQQIKAEEDYKKGKK